ncbi:MAG: LAGLIDADG family homing endonuclease, partial [Nitrososphaerota archaeon]
MIKRIAFPSLDDPLLAYETGVHVGDATMLTRHEKNEYSVTYWGNITETGFYERVLLPILYELYGLTDLKVNNSSHDNSIFIRIFSKSLVTFKSYKLELPVGRKDAMKDIPTFIRRNINLLINFIKGLFDADGSFVVINRPADFNGYPRITLSLCNESLIHQVNHCLRDLGIKTTCYSQEICDNRTSRRYNRWRIDINGKANISKFMKTVGFNNPVQVSRFKRWNVEIAQ